MSTFEIRITLIAAWITAASQSAQVRPVWIQESNQRFAGYGSSVASAGDVNGDGYDDVIVCAFAYTDDQAREGRAYLYLGSRFGPEKLPSWTIESDQAYATLGPAVGVGDVNGDGFDDVLVSNYMWSNDQYLEGRAMLFHGSARGLLATPAWSVEGNEQAAYLGDGAPAGDVNGDGYADVIVHASYADIAHVPQAEGAAFVYLGSSAGLSTTPVWSARGNQRFSGFGLGRSAGDVNGDGFDDLLVSAQDINGDLLDEGRAYLYLGSPRGPSPTADWIVEGDRRAAHFGSSLAQAGDVNGDGFDDVVIGAWNYDGSARGAAFLYLGSAGGLASTPAWTATGELAGDLFGYVAGAGDVDGDGFSDVIISSPASDHPQRQEGRACVYYGSASAPYLQRGWCFEGNQRDANFGWPLDTAGDVNADGLADVIFGANLFDNGERDEGRAWVFLGAPRQRVK
jgi:hypothetical protein